MPLLGREVSRGDPPLNDERGELGEGLGSDVREALDEGQLGRDVEIVDAGHAQDGDGRVAGVRQTCSLERSRRQRNALPIFVALELALT